MTEAEQIVADTLSKAKMDNMRHIYYFDDNIESESVMQLINDLQDKPKVDLFFSTRGGKTIEMSILIHFLNMHPDINIYLINELISCGIEILLKFKGKIFITNELELIMVHKYDRLEYSTRDVSYDKDRLKSITVTANNKLANRLRDLGFTEDQLSKFEEGGDIWWYPEDMKQLEKLTNVTVL